ncbi:MAG: 1,4-alpha-glucan-branching enzyme [Bacteroidetes bacterium]|nr:MAG: 1,4-alpha-glucan-branching enzyme [Bacteroidota bacterium]
MKYPVYLENDPYLQPFAEAIIGRLKRAESKEKELLGEKNSLEEFAVGFMYYGLQKQNENWILREWAPNATRIYLVGEFSEWQTRDEFSFQKKENGNWELELPLKTLKHLDLYKLHMCWEGGSEDRLPAWARRVVQDEQTHVFNAQVWDPPKPYKWQNQSPEKTKDFVPLVYEAHVGMATEEYKVGSFNEFRKNVLPGIKKSGYNTIQLMAIQEHPYYGSFGYHVSSFFAASSRFGTPDDLKALIDAAHGMGIFVVMDIVHSHAVKNEVEGISRYDGTLYQFFHEGSRGDHPAWDSRCFDYGKNEVLHFLLSNCKFWLTEYQFDGYRFDGITSMLYNDHGLGTAFTEYQQYYNGNQDDDAIAYIKLANKLIHQVNPDAISIAEEMSGMPGLATPAEQGGYGFDYRLAMGIPDFWIKTIKETRLEFWNVGDMYHNLSNKRSDEKTIHYAESHDQALVGDKTIIFWLMDKEMYFNMHVNHQNIIVDNGIALHKMIRLLTLATAGNGYLNFMGNEFGHPEWIDFPGRHNNWSYHYARRQWSLAKNEELRYRFLDSFDKEMIGFFKRKKIIQKHVGYPRVQNTTDQVLIFERGKYLFVFNFNPFQSFTDYAFEVTRGKYQVVLDTDNPAFGGYARQDVEYIHETHENAFGNPALRLYIPSLTAFVLEKK